NGVGIKKEIIPNLFKIEESYSTIGTEKEAGTGLGLVLVKEFVEKNNGSIQIESEEGQGTTIYVVFRSVEDVSSCDRNCLGSFDGVLQALSEKRKSGVFDVFFNEIEPIFIECYKSYSSRNVNKFAKLIKSFANEYEVKELMHFADSIQKSMQKFDVNQLNICFSEFDKLVAYIHKQEMRS
ncbi:MAG: ATP-binding protein, partial [Salinivirgaceae bacterium]